MACQNKFSLQLTLNFVIIPECCVLEAAPVIIWKLSMKCLELGSVGEGRVL